MPRAFHPDLVADGASLLSSRFDFAFVLLGSGAHFPLLAVGFIRSEMQMWTEQTVDTAGRERVGETERIACAYIHYLV